MASILSNAGTTLLSTDPVTVDSTHFPLHPSNIFRVDGLVVLITGGGTGGSDYHYLSRVVEVTEFRLTVYKV